MRNYLSGSLRIFRIFKFIYLPYTLWKYSHLPHKAWAISLLWPRIWGSISAIQLHPVCVSRGRSKIHPCEAVLICFHGITESLRLEKTFKMIKFNCDPSSTISSTLNHAHPQMPHPHVIWTLPRTLLQHFPEQSVSMCSSGTEQKWPFSRPMLPRQIFPKRQNW